MRNTKRNLSELTNIGYKNSKVGLIPHDWNSTRLDEIVDKRKKIRYGIVQTGNNLPIGTPCLRVVDLSSKTIDIESLIKTSEKINHQYRDTILEENDIVIILRGEIGKCLIIPKKLVGINITRGLARIRCSDNYDSLFINYQLQSSVVNKELLFQVNGTSLKEIPISGLKKVVLPIPESKIEQQKIAKILSTWDKAIEKTEQLIQAKTQLKKGLMQQLLTGKKRFKEFVGEEWKEYALSELVMFLKGIGLSKDKLDENGKNECILYGELYTSYSEVIDKVISSTNHNEGKLSIERDVLIPASTTTVGIDLATASSLKKSGVLLGGDINILRAKNSKYNPDFLAYYLTHIKKNDLASRAQGVTIIHLYGKHFSHVKIKLPTIKEQNKIMQLLASIQKEIDIHTSQKQLLVDQKKGLMQKLLTGEVKV